MEGVVFGCNDESSLQAVVPKVGDTAILLSSLTSQDRLHGEGKCSTIRKIQKVLGDIALV